MKQKDFSFLVEFLKMKSGLVLSENKDYLIESRLLPIIRENGLEDIESLVARMKDPSSGPLCESVIEAMMTNESLFFRDKIPFDIFAQKILPHLIKTKAQTKKLRIWSAAASTGQEPYSLCMQLKEAECDLSGWSQEIIGTDISTDVLRRAKTGKFTQFEVQRGLPVQLLVKYFRQSGHDWEISPDIRSMVQYRKLNLLDDFSWMGRFDVVFCRNVLIYFDQETKVEILERMVRQLSPGGFLVLGAAETVIGLTKTFKPLKECRGVYVPADADTRAFQKVAVA